MKPQLDLRVLQPSITEPDRLEAGGALRRRSESSLYIMFLLECARSQLADVFVETQTYPAGVRRVLLVGQQVRSVITSPDCRLRGMFVQSCHVFPVQQVCRPRQMDGEHSILPPVVQSHVFPCAGLEDLEAVHGDSPVVPHLATMCLSSADVRKETDKLVGIRGTQGCGQPKGKHGRSCSGMFRQEAVEHEDLVSLPAEQGSCPWSDIRLHRIKKPTLCQTSGRRF